MDSIFRKNWVICQYQQSDVWVKVSMETVSQSYFVIASDRRERGNLFISIAL